MKEGKILEKENFNSLFSIHLCEDGATHFLAIIHALQTIPESFPMNRIGTVLNEHFFALLRFKSGKEQTLKSFKHVFQQIVLSMKRQLLPKIIIKIRRNCDTGIACEGVYVLSKQELLNCKALALRVLTRTGLVFPRETDFYEMIESLTNNNKTFNEYTTWDMNFFRSLINTKLQIKKIHQIINIGLFIHQISGSKKMLLEEISKLGMRQQLNKQNGNH